ncbi:MAG: DUF2207 domain-containing protein [Gammaproteobacteria bacterium]|nr:DUF2207 domain-containing protein [Gammaproteobacteria bacterium]MBL7000234.1 DUF2207 domain-containing protein [Gammaproteobacteria bacterium]
MNPARLMLALVLFMLPLQPYAAEVISAFHSDITIQRDGQLLIRETIQVTAENEQIQRGIYRDFPTRYQDEVGNITLVSFELLSVKRDHQQEPYRLQQRANGVRIYIGQQDVFLPPASYQYQIEYQTDRQLGFFADFDELYFNVTGNDWSFPILQASANVTLPEPVSSHSVALGGFTGKKGSTQQNLTHYPQLSNQFHFETTQALNRNEGLTIVASWPKGIINEPDSTRKRQYFIDDNAHSLIAAGGFLLLLLYYSIAWYKVGKDPASRVIMPLYQPPSGFSPASTRFISRMAYDKTCFTAAIVNLTIKGYISIQQNQRKQFTLQKQPSGSATLAAGESVILQQLFGQSEQITLSQTEHVRIANAINQHETSLRRDFEKLYFLTNSGLFTMGLALTVLTILFSFSRIPHDDILQATLVASIFSLIPFLIIGLQFWRALTRHKRFSIASMTIQVVFLGLFFFILNISMAQIKPLLGLVAWPLTISLYLLIATNVLFQQWLKAPTLAGRKLLNRIEGFRLYLSVAEEDEIKLSGAPRFSSDIYQSFLPYALALGVDHAWSEKLERSIAAGLVQKGFQPSGFLYYHASHTYSGFADSLSSNLDSAISSASTAPGSSSGSSGGSSGGGGGGGGGGGW